MMGCEIIAQGAKAFEPLADEVIEGAKETREFSF
jgi:hypothetical protein